jgi:hypothetical protein
VPAARIPKLEIRRLKPKSQIPKTES